MLRGLIGGRRHFGRTHFFTTALGKISLSSIEYRGALPGFQRHPVERGFGLLLAKLDCRARHQDPSGRRTTRPQAMWTLFGRVGRRRLSGAEEGGAGNISRRRSRCGANTRLRPLVVAPRARGRASWGRGRCGQRPGARPRLSSDKSDVSTARKQWASGWPDHMRPSGQPPPIGFG
jgi:hypothetical protein